MTTRRQDSKPSAVGVVSLMRRALQMHRRFFVAACTGGIESVPAFTAMRAISEEPSNSQLWYVARTGIDKSTMAVLLRQLEKAGYVVMLKNPEDKRATLVNLTSAGRKELSRAQAAYEEAERLLLLAVPSGHKKAAYEILASMANASNILNERTSHK